MFYKNICIVSLAGLGSQITHCAENSFKRERNHTPLVTMQETEAGSAVAEENKLVKKSKFQSKLQKMGLKTLKERAIGYFNEASNAQPEEKSSLYSQCAGLYEEIVTRMGKKASSSNYNHAIFINETAANNAEDDNIRQFHLRRVVDLTNLKMERISDKTSLDYRDAIKINRNFGLNSLDEVEKENHIRIAALFGTELINLLGAQARANDYFLTGNLYTILSDLTMLNNNKTNYSEKAADYKKRGEKKIQDQRFGEMIRQLLISPTEESENTAHSD